MRMIVAVAVSVIAAAPGLAQTDTAAHDAMVRTNDKIQFAAYPRESLRRGEEGVVGINVLTDSQGRLRDCAVTKTSGYRALDEASCDLLLEHMRMRPYLAPNGGGVVRRQDGQVVWKLPPGYAAAGKPGPPGQKIAAERKICHVQTKTGSLVASQRVCLTKAQWQQQVGFAQDELQNMKPKFQPGGP